MKKVFYSPFFFIFLLAFAFRCLWFLAVLLKDPSGFMLPDSWSYWKIAENLESAGIYSQNDQLVPDCFRTPLFPLFIFILKKVFFGLHGIIFIQLIISSATCALCFYAAGQLFQSSKAGTFAGIFLAIDLPSVFFANTLLTETLFTFVLLCSVAFFIAFLKTGKNTQLVLSAVFSGLAILCRPIAILLPFLFALTILFFNYSGTYNKSSAFFLKLKFVLVFIVASYTVVSPWIIRNYLSFGAPMVSPVGNINLLYYTAAAIKAEKENKPLFNVQDDYRKISAGNFNWSKPEEIVRYSDYCRKEAIRIIVEQPFAFLKNQLTSIVYFFAKPLRNYIDLQLGNAAGYHSATLSPKNSLGKIAERVWSNSSATALIFVVIQIILISVHAILAAAFFLLKKDRLGTPMVLILLIIFYFAISSTFTETDARMRVPAMPFIAIIAGYGAFLFASKTQKNQSNL